MLDDLHEKLSMIFFQFPCACMIISAISLTAPKPAAALVTYVTWSFRYGGASGGDAENQLDWSFARSGRSSPIQQTSEGLSFSLFSSVLKVFSLSSIPKY